MILKRVVSSVLPIHSSRHTAHRIMVCAALTISSVSSLLRVIGFLVLFSLYVVIMESAERTIALRGFRIS